MKLDINNPDINLDQQKAIYTKNKNILVSAPAGSGKTKILVNRMMEHLLNDGYSVDDFLVVTFTAAAALEMKQRLSVQIDKYPELSKEKEKLPYAYITNFHGFCSSLIKKYGALIDIPTDFEIIEDPTLVKNEAYQYCLNQWVNDNTFLEFVQLYYPGNDLSKFFSQLMNLYESMHVIENKDTFLEEVINTNYETCETDHWPVIKLMQDYLMEILEQSKINFDRLCEQAQMMGAEDFFERPVDQKGKSLEKAVPADAYQDWLDQVEKSLNVEYISYEALMKICNAKLEDTYNIKWKDTDYPDSKCPERKKFDKLKKDIQDPFKDTYEELYTKDNKELLMRSRSFLRMFLGKDGLIDQYSEAYKAIKLKRNYLDFNDLEDYAIALLDPSLPIASLLQSRIKEVMVDEYQDTNGVQEKIVNLITQGTSINKFMVGDIKQSIYRFRRADPKIFNEKYDEYEVYGDALPEGKNVRIDLHYNYRSNKIVLDSINYIFNMMMDHSIGDVEYQGDDNHQLNYDFYRKKDPQDKYDHETRFDTELLLYDKKGTGALSNDELEATLVADRILKMVHGETIDTFDKKPRAIDFKDIAILTRTVGSLVTFKKVFHKMGIPGHIVLSAGYYHSSEIKAMITFMNALLNPLDDISMISVLRGNYVISHFKDQEIYDLRMKYPKQTIYEAIKQEEKYQEFLNQFHDLQNYIKDYPSVLLDHIYSTTKYPLLVEGLFNGEQRKANLDLLMDYMYDHNDSTIASIIHDLNQKIELGTDHSPAMVLDENDNMVQFMTIHKSKGLEFPIVFVCNMNHGMNKQDVREPVIIDGANGIALKPRGYEEVADMQIITEYKNPYHKLLSMLAGKQSVSEEMRILYVALTRASQKLVMTGGCDLDYLKGIKDEAEFMNTMPLKGLYIAPRTFRNKKSYLDWVLLAYFNHPSIIQSFSYQNFDLKGIKTKVDYLDHPNINNTRLALKVYSQEEIEEMSKVKLIYTKESKEVYPLILMPEIEKVDTTIAVTKLIDEVPYERVYTNKRKLSATEFGSLVHQFFEYYLFDHSRVEDVIEYYAKLGLWNEMEVQELLNYKADLQRFIDSDVFAYMKKSQQVLREKEFSYQMENGIIIHGTFDVLCLNPDEITIIDYKTDRVDAHLEEDKLMEIHRPQMSYYKEIIGKMYPDRKVRAIVYYLEIGRYVVL